MPDTVEVAASDVQVVNEVLLTAFRAFGGSLVHVPHFGDAIEACTRMTAAAQQAQMPEDPVSGDKALAIALHETLREYADAGFDEHQAFRLVEIRAQAVAQLGLMRTMHGG